jgi:hypothetical protein
MRLTVAATASWLCVSGPAVHPDRIHALPRAAGADETNCLRDILTTEASALFSRGVTVGE